MKRVAVILLSMFIFSLLLTCCSQDGERINLYFANMDKTALVTQRYVFEKENITIQEKAEMALEALLAGPLSPEQSPLISPNTQILDLTMKDGILTVNFSAAFEGAGEFPTDAIMARSSVIKTLTEIKGIDKVQLLVDGASIISASTGEPIPALGAGDIITSPGGDTMDKVVLTLYFFNAQTNLLKEEKRVITVKENTAMAKNIVQELIKGPENKALVSLLSSDASVISADTKEGVCFVNFNQAFQDKSITEEWKVQMAIYSIVNSLTELSSVEQVQFLFEGEKIEALQKVTINEPFSRNDMMIEDYVPVSNETETELEGETNDEL